MDSLPNFQHLAAFLINCDYLKYKPQNNQPTITDEEILAICNNDEFAARCYTIPYSFESIIAEAQNNGKITAGTIEAMNTIKESGNVVEPNADYATGFGLYMQCAAFINDQKFIDLAKNAMLGIYDTSFVDQMFENINNDEYKVVE